MSKALEKHPDYVDVECSRCGHAWWTTTTSSWFASDVVYCPSCQCPLKRPSIMDTYNGIKTEEESDDTV